ncbi:MAG: hypothetical protein AUJ92_19940 [Armatimonadetes bacterium CG2_30_59_28]|nr:MAG: hypothetical protein AUJ92_19940 [Armatimonadetes bacterium CG2_30_59_28]PIU60547.1 MAG: hypothetical protein COS85_24240 [Armatimonadetes bacterium CG07_land_8_20_14_0_80_59_28]PIY49565.1 MAG: hypothetical protein COZ05_00040 [Armatimonadetes bacterium CG_4_10_14_3_um_filter_59_10]
MTTTMLVQESDSRTNRGHCFSLDFPLQCWCISGGPLAGDLFVEEANNITQITLSDILDDLRAADQTLRKFEQRYWMSSDVFYNLYSQGRLDDGENREDFSEWAGFYKVKQHREELLRKFSEQRLRQLRDDGDREFVLRTVGGKQL